MSWRAEALFASPVQMSARATPAEVRTAVTTTLRRYGVRGCAMLVATEFGNHPDLAVRRMSWAIAAVHLAYRRERRRPLPRAATFLSSGG